MTLINNCRVHHVHPDNPFVYRLECPSRECRNVVWPDEIHDVSGFPKALRGGDVQRCSGCIETWLRTGQLTHVEILSLRGAKAEDVTAWEAKCAEARPDHIFEGD